MYGNIFLLVIFFVGALFGSYGEECSECIYPRFFLFVMGGVAFIFMMTVCFIRFGFRKGMKNMPTIRHFLFTGDLLKMSYLFLWTMGIVLCAKGVRMLFVPGVNMPVELEEVKVILPVFLGMGCAYAAYVKLFCGRAVSSRES